MDKFIITGLPRSRTGWLANLFTYGPSFCVHDGVMLGHPTFCSLMEIASRNPEIRHVGNSDSGIALTRNPSDYDQCKVIIVERPLEDAYRSFMAYFTSNPYRDQWKIDPEKTRLVFQTALAGLQEFKKLPTVMTVQFSELEDEHKVSDLWSFIVPEQSFNRDRWAVLDKLRVNPASEKVSVKWVS